MSGFFFAYRIRMELAKARQKFHQHKSGAKSRGIDFQFTFEQWLAEWGDKLDQIGRHEDQYGMCRIMDCGPYAPGNVYIGTPKRNAHTRRLVNFDRKIQQRVAEERARGPNPIPDECEQNPWLPDELRPYSSYMKW